MPETPKHSLAEIKSIVEKFLDGSRELIVFSAPSRSTRCVIEVLLCNQLEAEETIAKGIMLLENNDFSQRVYQWGTTMDVYGLENYKDANWYIKLSLVEEDGEIALDEISFHHNKKPLTLIDGRILGTEEEEN